MHDDLGSGLTRINYVTQLALNKDIAKDDLLNIKNISTGLVESMREIIWAMKDENNTVEELIFYIKNYTTNYCAVNQLECYITIPDSLPQRIVRGQNRRHIYLCIKEILHNIVKHAKASSVRFELSVDKEWTITIADNGIGLLQANTKGNGLKNITKRMEAVGGKVSYPEVLNGTIVQLSIPL
jgi:signal transduction histidine kinase